MRGRAENHFLPPPPEASRLQGSSSGWAVNPTVSKPRAEPGTFCPGKLPGLLIASWRARAKTKPEQWAVCGRGSRAMRTLR